ncbi:hypothetical protein EC01304_3003, partial [Escherichia coli 0.1304]
MLARPLASTK